MKKIDIGYYNDIDENNEKQQHPQIRRIMRKIAKLVDTQKHEKSSKTRKYAEL